MFFGSSYLGVTNSPSSSLGTSIPPAWGRVPLVCSSEGFVVKTRSRGGAVLLNSPSGSGDGLSTSTNKNEHCVIPMKEK